MRDAPPPPPRRRGPRRGAVGPGLAALCLLAALLGNPRQEASEIRYVDAFVSPASARPAPPRSPSPSRLALPATGSAAVVPAAPPVPTEVDVAQRSEPSELLPSVEAFSPDEVVSFLTTLPSRRLSQAVAGPLCAALTARVRRLALSRRLSSAQAVAVLTALSQARLWRPRTEAGAWGHVPCRLSCPALVDAVLEAGARGAVPLAPADVPPLLGAAAAVWYANRTAVAQVAGFVAASASPLWTAPLLSAAACGLAALRCPPGPDLDAVVRRAVALSRSPAQAAATLRALSALPAPHAATVGQLLQGLDEQTVQALDAEGVGQVAQAVAALRCRDSALLRRLARRSSAPAVLPRLDGPALAALAQAFATARIPAHDLFAAIATRVQSSSVLPLLRPYELATLCWACATLRARPPGLLPALAAHALRRPGGVAHFGPKSLVRLVWAYGSLMEPAEPLFAAVGDLLVAERLEKCSAAELANVLWAFARVNCTHRALWRAAAERCARPPGMAAFTPRQLGTVAWAFATAGVRRRHTMVAIARRALSPGFFQDCDAVTTAQLLWAFGKLRSFSRRVLDAGAQRVLQLGSLAGPEIAMVAWAFARLRYRHTPLLAHLAALAQSPAVARTFNWDSAQLTLWAFATLSVRSRPLMAALVPRLVHPALLPTAHAQGVANALWALAVLDCADDTTLRPLVQWAVAHRAALPPAAFVPLHFALLHLQLRQADVPGTTELLDEHLDFQNDCLAAFLDTQRPREEEKRVHALVKAFKMQGMEVELDVPLFDAGGYQADLLVSGAPVVVDFEGPRDFLRGPGGPGDVRPVGSTVLRRRQLRWFGYEVVSAPMRNWAELNTRDKRREFVTAVMRVALWALKRTAEGFVEDSAEDFSDDF